MSHTILILEDEPDIRELLAIALEGPGLHCELTGHLAEAKSLAQRLKPDFVLTDIHLPDGSGLDFLTFLRERLPGTPCAVITAFGDMDSAITAMRNGAIDYLTKPLDLRELKALIKRHLQEPNRRPAAPAKPDTPPATPTPAVETGDKHALLSALEATRWNKRAAADRMGLSYRQFRYRLEKHGIQ